MWKFYLEILGDEFEFTPLNKDEFKLKTSKLAVPYSDSVTETDFVPMIDAKGLNNSETLYSRFFEYLIDTQSTECYFVIRGDNDDIEYTGFLNGLDIEIDNNNKWYKINHTADNVYTNIQSRKSIKFNLYEKISRGVEINKPVYFDSNFKGCLTLQSVLDFFVSELVGIEYSLSSEFLNNDTNPVNTGGYLDLHNSIFINPFKYLYLVQSSNIIASVDNTSYDQAEVYELDWQTLSNDLYHTLGLVFRIDVDNKLFVVENIETDIESRQSGYDFNQTKFAKFFRDKDKYRFNKIDIPNSETWANTYENKRFADQSLTYDISSTRRSEELDKRHDVSMLFDLIGVSTSPDTFPTSGSFLIATNGDSEILYELSDYLDQELQQSQPNALTYLILNNSFKTNYINLSGFASTSVLPGLPAPVATNKIETVTILDDFVIGSGDTVYIDLYGYIKSGYIWFGNEEEYTFASQGGSKFFSLFLIDTNVQNDPDESPYANLTDFFNWAGGMSNIVEFDDDTIINYPLIRTGGKDYITFNSRSRIAIKATDASNRCKLILTAYPTFYTNSKYSTYIKEADESTSRPPIEEFVLDYKIYTEGSAIVPNSPLQWSYLIPNYHRNERYLNEAIFSFDNHRVELNNKKRLRQLHTVTPAIGDYENFDAHKILKTPFGDDAEVVTSTYNPLSNELDLQLIFDQEQRPFSDNFILEMYFSEMQGSAVIDNFANKITVLLAVGADITDIEPLFRLSQKATIDKSGSQDFTDPVNYIVTAEDGTQRVYEVSMIANTPQFQISLDYDSSTPKNLASIITSDSIIVTWRSDNIEPSEYVGNDLNITKSIDPSQLSINASDYSKIVNIVLSYVSDPVMDLGLFTGLTQFGLYDCTFDSLIAPSSTQVFTVMIITRSAIKTIDLSKITSDSSGCYMLLNDNNFASETVDSMLYSISSMGWSGLTVVIDGNNDTPKYSIQFLDISGGSSYIVGEIITPTNGSGSGLEIEVTGVDGSGGVVSGRILSVGSGYSTVPSVFISDGSGTGATISALTSYEYLTSTLSSSVTVTT